MTLLKRSSSAYSGPVWPAPYSHAMALTAEANAKDPTGNLGKSLDFVARVRRCSGRERREP